MIVQKRARSSILKEYDFLFLKALVCTVRRQQPSFVQTLDDAPVPKSQIPETRRGFGFGVRKHPLHVPSR